ncbi:MAG: hypothetical protein HQL56_03000 [Magnetococcales bacterium]|nr:hypothetical protein [Magnetococcales bacterium]
MRPSLLARLTGVFLLGKALCGWSATPPALLPPAEETLGEMRRLVSSMRTSSLGPFDGVYWFCRDGAVLAPSEGNCRNHGGGWQHGRHSAARQWLAERGVWVGTLFAAWEEGGSEASRRQRLRQIPLERYLMQLDGGWVMRGALSHAGLVQIEDEIREGEALLLGLFEDGPWVERELLLARELLRAVPHGGGEGDATRRLRQMARQLGEIHPSFNELRIRIHGQPATGVTDEVRQWLEREPGLTTEERRLGEEIRTALERYYGPEGRLQRLEKLSASLGEEVTAYVKGIFGAASLPQAIERLTGLMEAIRHTLPVARDALHRLQLLLALQEVEGELRLSALALGEPKTVAEGVAWMGLLIRAAWAGGWLSEGEKAALLTALAQVEQGQGGREAAHTLRRLVGWMEGGIRHTFAEALVTYESLDARAGRFVDEQIRGSVVLPLAAWAAVLEQGLTPGADALLCGHPVQGLRGGSPGRAQGVLRSDGNGGGEENGKGLIRVLPPGREEAPPAEGLLSVGEGNPVSHLQILARNRRIPFAEVTPEVWRALGRLNGLPMELSVSSDGRVSLDRAKAKETVVLAPVTVPPVDASQSRPLGLKTLHAGLAGRVVGGKAAGVGELARRYPGSVARAVAFPFGFFLRLAHPALQEAWEAARQGMRQVKAGNLPEAELSGMLQRLRQEIAAMAQRPEVRGEVEGAIRAEFNWVEGLGLFVRSDSNAEDLPGYSGAGLNETVPNVVGLEAQLTAMGRVWASVFSDRAVGWRLRGLANPWDVVPGVLLMETIPSEKSGVLVTTDLTGGSGGVTVATAWGIGGAVDNSAAETLLLRFDGGTGLIGEAKAPWQRLASDLGGLEWRPAPKGRVLAEEERQSLRSLAQRVMREHPEGAWNVEFAFARNRLWLLQIRPFSQPPALAELDRLPGSERRLAPGDEWPVRVTVSGDGLAEAVSACLP